MRIRFAAPDDSEAIAAVISEAFAEYEPRYTPRAFAATTPDSGEIRRRFDEGAVWAALKNEKIVGTVSVVPKDEGLYVRSMAISPGEQSGGIGLKLLETVERFALENGFTKMFLYTTPFLAGAIRLYEQNGFERRGEINADEFFGTPLILMEKELN